MNNDYETMCVSERVLAGYYTVPNMITPKPLHPTLSSIKPSAAEALAYADKLAHFEEKWQDYLAAQASHSANVRSSNERFKSELFAENSKLSPEVLEFVWHYVCATQGFSVSDEFVDVFEELCELAGLIWIAAREAKEKE